jgi:glutaredoxin
LRQYELRVVVFTRQSCPLCKTAIAAAHSVFGTENVTLVDVDLDLGLLEKYTARVPVVETHGGVVIAEGVVTESMLAEFSFRR